jgi:Domain of unknown function DUF29
MPGSAGDLYEQDFVRWTEQQSSALREAAAVGTNLPLDWENLAEEIGSLGRSQRHELRSRIAVVIEHLLKLEHSPAVDPRRGWIDTIGRERFNIEDLLQDSPSLRSQVRTIIDQLQPRVARLAATSLFGYGETARKLPVPSYSEEQVLGEWFPWEAPLPAGGEREEPAQGGLTQVLLEEGGDRVE